MEQGSRVLGLSLSKILLIILIIVVLWKGFGLVSRLASERRAAVKRSAAGRATRTSRADGAGMVDLRQCPRCGAYVDPREGCGCAVRRDEARRARF
jgi:hypothetical protein